MGDSPYTKVMDNNEFANTVPPEWDYDEPGFRHYQATQSIMNLVNPESPEILEQEPARDYNYNQKPMRMRRRGLW